MSNNILIIKKLQVAVEKKEIIKGIDLTLKSGEIHAIMGPNGAGKTTLAMSIIGKPELIIKSAQFTIGNDLINNLPPDERAKKGIFVSFQHPVEISGVSFLAFFRTAYKALHPQEKIPLSEFKKNIVDAFRQVGLPENFMQRFVNEGFSGGEKKRAEIAQLIILKPKFAILDEIDSGLDIDSLKVVARIIHKAVKTYHIGVLLITHYQRILHYLNPDVVHILIDGKIKRSGSIKLIKTIEEEGYAAI